MDRKTVAALRTLSGQPHVSFREAAALALEVLP